MSRSALDADVIVIGAGPAGSVAGAILASRGHRVRMIERQHFPRFSIGESLLPQCMEFLDEAGMLEPVQRSAGDLSFQLKNGATFVRDDEITAFDFAEQFTEGWSCTYQVKRADFDHLLARQAERQGVEIRWGDEITRVDINGPQPVLGVRGENGADYSLTANWVLDASGFGRVLPRLLELDAPSDFPSRSSMFTHIEDRIVPGEFDRDKIRITVHPEHRDVWYWLIPFADGRTSVGVVAEDWYFERLADDPARALVQSVEEEPALRQLLRKARYDTPVRRITGYARNVERLWGQGYALLGNAGEFLDPVFSSGVTIAMKSASLACAVLERQLQGETVDWETDYSEPLRAGVDTFRCFVEAWYDGRFQDVIFAPDQSPNIRRMICSILAGYAWDLNNPYVKESERRLDTLATLCRGSD